MGWGGGGREGLGGGEGTEPMRTLTLGHLISEFLPAVSTLPLTGQAHPVDCTQLSKLAMLCVPSRGGVSLSYYHLLLSQGLRPGMAQAELRHWQQVVILPPSFPCGQSGSPGVQRSPACSFWWLGFLPWYFVCPDSSFLDLRLQTFLFPPPKCSRSETCHSPTCLLQLPW